MLTFKVLLKLNYLKKGLAAGRGGAIYFAVADEECLSTHTKCPQVDDLDYRLLVIITKET